MSELKRTISPRTRAAGGERRGTRGRQGAARRADRRAPEVARRPRDRARRRAQARRRARRQGDESEGPDRPDGRRRRPRDKAAAAVVASRAAGPPPAIVARLKPAIAVLRGQGPACRCRSSGAVTKLSAIPTALGGQTKGVTVAAPPDATVSTPVDAWVAYAGPVPLLWTTLDPQRGRGLLYGVGGHGADPGVRRAIRSGGRAGGGHGIGRRARRRRRPLLAPTSLFSISNSERTTRSSTPSLGGRNRTSKRRADDSQGFLSRVRRRARRGRDRSRARRVAGRRAESLRDRRRDLSSAQSVRRRVREDSQRLRREAGRGQADRGGDQRHAVVARPAFQLHGRRRLSRDAALDQGRVRRPRHRGDGGGGAHQGGLADRRHAGLQGRADVGRHHRRHRRRLDPGHDARSGGRQDARPDQLGGDAEDRARRRRKS